MQKNQKKIQDLCKLIKNNGLDGYIIPSHDEFRNEYVPENYRRLQWLTGFTGSNGTLIVTLEKLIFFTDGRYLSQAKNELGDDYIILDMYRQESCSIATKHIRDGVIGYDPFVESIYHVQYYQKMLQKNGSLIKSVRENLVDVIWNRELALSNEFTIISDKDAGLSQLEKVIAITSEIAATADCLLLNSLDSISWLLNMRGNAIRYTPFAIGYVILRKDGEHILFSDYDYQIDGFIHYKLKDIQRVFLDLVLAENIIQTDRNASYWFKEIAKNQLVISDDPVKIVKACKNSREIENIREAHRLDSIAIQQFICWLEENIDNNITEQGAADKLLECRQKNKTFIYPSFNTISAYAENGAIIHYSPTKTSNKIIGRNSLYLLDSGGQYHYGTTDVTRTFCFGTPTEEQMRAYTLVLKGMIAISALKFPKGATGAQLDGIARQYLWQCGLDYAHGTGHGVGYFLSVHEGPQGISRLSTTPLKAGMIISNEPGYYKDGHYGIRIENLLLIKQSSLQGFLEFETLTLVPIATNLINYNVLTKSEAKWLEQYQILSSSI